MNAQLKPRTILLVLLVAFLAATTGCSLYSSGSYYGRGNYRRYWCHCDAAARGLDGWDFGPPGIGSGAGQIGSGLGFNQSINAYDHRGQ